MNKVAIMQPYFAPYIGYISLLKNTNKFILFDTPQFIRHGWIERNRIIKQGGGWSYIKAPLVKHSRDTPINEIRINNSISWQVTLLAQLNVYKKHARYYEETYHILENILSEEYEDIVALNQNLLYAICSYLEFKVEILTFSEMKLEIETPKEADEWALNICTALGDVDEYWNPPGGMDFFDRSKYEEKEIGLKFHCPKLTPYSQLGVLSNPDFLSSTF